MKNSIAIHNVDIFVNRIFNSGFLNVPCIRMDQFAHLSFSFSGSNTWKALPLSLHIVMTLPAFWSGLKTHLFQKCTNWSTVAVSFLPYFHLHFFIFLVHVLLIAHMSVWLSLSHGLANAPIFKVLSAHRCVGKCVIWYYCFCLWWNIYIYLIYNIIFPT